jgi:hypothetical protein
MTTTSKSKFFELLTQGSVALGVGWSIQAGSVEVLTKAMSDFGRGGDLSIEERAEVYIGSLGTIESSENKECRNQVERRGLYLD